MLKLPIVMDEAHSWLVRVRPQFGWSWLELRSARTWALTEARLLVTVTQLREGGPADVAAELARELGLTLQLVS